MLRIVSGKYGGRYIKTLSEYNTRPTSNRIKESLFNIIQSKIPDSNVLDLFSGSGSLGLEALSRGSKRSVFVEKNRFAFKILQQNIRELNCIDSAEILSMDALKAIPYLISNKFVFDIIFMDPPYDRGLEDHVFNLLKGSDLITDKGIIVLEHKTEIKKPDQLPGFARYDLRKYGYTSISFYRKDN